VGHITGKSLEVLAAYLAPKQKRVTLRLTKEGREAVAGEDFEYIADIEMDEDEVPQPSQPERSRRKRRRIVSAPVVCSGEESDELVESDEEVTKDEAGWTTYATDRPCIPCSRLGNVCYLYARRAKGPQRNACVLCRSRKRLCNFPGDSDDSYTLPKRGKSRGKEKKMQHRASSQRTRAKTVETEQSSDEGSEVELQKRRRARRKAKMESGEERKGKAKAKGKGKGKGKQRYRSVSTMSGVAVKSEDEDNGQWLSGKSISMISFTTLN